MPHPHLLPVPVMVILAIAQGACSLPGAPPATDRIGTFSSDPIAKPTAIVTGPDGNLWFTDAQGNRIGRMTQSGSVTQFDLGHVSAGDITSGPDHNLWFTEHDTTPVTDGKAYPDGIGRITPGGQISAWNLPADSLPVGIAKGPDGNIWFSDAAEHGVPGHPDQLQHENRIGRISPTGVISEFPLPTPDGDPGAITAGPDGALWFVESKGARIGRIDTNGATTEFALPAGSSPGAITGGPDGALWFTNDGQAMRDATVGRITPSGSITQFALPQCEAVCNRNLRGVTAAPDGNIWFTESKGYGEGSVWKATPGGNLTSFAVMAWATGITVGPDGNIWFTEDLDSKVGRVSLK